MKKLTSLAGVALMAIAPGANAAVTIVEPTTVSTTVVQTPDGSFNIGFSDAFLAAGAFSDSLTFATDVAGLLSVTATTTANTVGGPNDTDFLSILLSGPGINAAVTPSPDNTDLNEDRQLNNLLIGAGTYRLDISGTSGTQTGGFGGNVTFLSSTAPVPEPATWAMMLFGFGAVGFGMRRRRGEKRGQVRVRFAL